MKLIFIYCSKQCAAAERTSPQWLLLPGINISLSMSREVPAPRQHIFLMTDPLEACHLDTWTAKQYPNNIPH